MRRIFGAMVSVVFLCIVGYQPTSVRAAGKGKNIPVIITLADQLSDAIRSDGGGPYRDGVGSIVAYISPSDGGALIVATSTFPASGRKLQYYFGNCVADCTGFPFLTGSAVSQILAAPRSGTGTPITDGFMGMLVGQELDGFNHIRVLGQADEWTLCMKPDPNDTTSFCSNASPTDQTYMRIKRVQSNVWEMFATDTTPGGRRDVAALLKTTGNNKRKVTTNEGSYSMPFSMTVTCVNANCS